MGYAQVQTATGGLPASTFEEMFRHHYRKCVTFAYRFVRSREDAEDLTQEAFLRAYRAFDRYDCKRPFDSWMFRIIANLFIDHLRKQRKMTLYSLDAPLPGKNGVNRMVEIPDSTTDPANVLLRDVLDERLLQALASLPKTYSETLLLVDVEELSYEEAAQKMRCAVGTIRSRVHRSRQLLRQILSEA